MTLVVAKIAGKQICIVSDTSLTEMQGDSKIKNYSLEKSVIKSIIFNGNLCISFAGDFHFAEMALKQIESYMEIEVVSEMLLKVNKESILKNSPVEFIVCSGNPMPLIYEIHSGKKEKALYAWIGDKDGHTIFKNALAKKDSFANSNLTITVDNPLPAELSDMGKAMDVVINKYPNHEIGGFRVEVTYTDSFKYVSYIQSYRELPISLTFTPDKMFHVLGHPKASEGGYNVNFVGYSEDYSNIAIHIQQGALGLLYQKENNVPKAKIKSDMDEVEFMMYINSKGIKFKYLSENRSKEYKEESNGLMIKGEYEKAISILDKLLFIEKGSERAYHLCNKGMCLIKLKNTMGFEYINDAVRLQPNLTSHATSFIKQNNF